MTIPVQLTGALDLARWSCVRDRLRAIVGEERFGAWFSGLRCEGIQIDSIYLSVPTRFIKCWIQEHYAETVRICCQAEMPAIEYIGIGVRNGLHVARHRVTEVSLPLPMLPPPAPVVAPPPPAPIVAPHPFNNVPHDIAVAVVDYLARAEAAGEQESAVAGLLEVVRPPQLPQLLGKVQTIQIAVAKHYGVSRLDLLSSRRTHNIVRPRQVAMFLAKHLTFMSLPQIGRKFGNRDHTTVLHAVRKIERLRATDDWVRADVDRLLDQLKIYSDLQEATE